MPTVLRPGDLVHPKGFLYPLGKPMYDLYRNAVMPKVDPTLSRTPDAPMRLSKYDEALIGWASEKHVVDQLTPNITFFPARGFALANHILSEIVKAPGEDIVKEQVQAARTAAALLVDLVKEQIRQRDAAQKVQLQQRVQNEYCRPPRQQIRRPAPNPPKPPKPPPPKAK